MMRARKMNDNTVKLSTGKIRIVIAGDIAPIRNFDQLMTGEDALEIYGDVLPVLQSADCCIGNLEAPLAGDAFIAKSGAAFAGRPEHIGAMSPFSLVTMANNHVFDTGEEGFYGTLELLDQQGIHHLGAGSNRKEAEKPFLIRRNGLCVAVFNMSEGEDCMAATENRAGVSGWDVDGTCSRIRNAKELGMNGIVVIVHCGLEYYPYPPMYVYEAFQKIAEAGADLVLGHHVHVPQGRTIFGETPAFFSLGNFVFYQENTLLHRKTGYLVDVTFGTGGLLNAEPVPYRIGASGVSLLKGKEKDAFDQLFAEISAPLSDSSSAADAWNACLAYYGSEGFASELERIAQTLRDSPEKGAAMLRNRIHCMQHKMQWTDGMNRIIDGTLANADPQYLQMVKRFFTETLSN